MPDEVIESARVDGCPEGRLFARIAVPMMVPGLVTVFLFQFVAVWNNFLLPFIMLSDENKFPLTVGPVHAAEPRRRPRPRCTAWSSPGRCCRSSR